VFRRFGTTAEIFSGKPTSCVFRNIRKPTCTGSYLARMIHPLRYNSFHFLKEKTMKTLKVVLLMAVIALGLAGTAKAALTTCCPSADCCASCSGCK
jgi:hypothetical protein